nr:hypothetical protein [Tanacetum cinerariifolium]
VKEIVHRLLEEVESWNGGLSKTLILKKNKMKKTVLLGQREWSNILKSIDEGSFLMAPIREPLTEGTEGAPHLGPERPLIYSDLSPEEKDQYNAGIRATNILLQGLPEDIYTLIKCQRHLGQCEDAPGRIRINQRRSRVAAGRDAAGYGGVQNRVGNANPGQAIQVKCYNCNGTGHIAWNCTQLKHPQNSEYYKDKMLLMQAQENGVALDAKQLLFLAGGHDNAIDDDAPTAQTMFMANLSSVDPITDEARPSYDLDILSEYVKDNAVPVVHSNVSSVPSDTYMMIYNDMNEPRA